jgi:pimeloyl-ACP methyl ester carboxylesterase
MLPLRTCLFITLTSIASLLATGCASDIRNPSFPVTEKQARAALEKMERHPRPLERPLVIIGGYHELGWVLELSGRRFRKLVPESDQDQVVLVNTPFTPTFDECRDEVIEQVDAALGSTGRDETIEVDVVGMSMGGLLARYAALPIPGRKRLKIARLFTIASPHDGAKLADFRLKLGPVLYDQRIRDMASGSLFLARLNTPVQQAIDTPMTGGGDGERDRGKGDDPGDRAGAIDSLNEPQGDAFRDGRAFGDYTLVPYVRLGDAIVGAENAAPPGQNVWWLPGKPLRSAHLAAQMDSRIIADIGRRLRGERPFTHPPPAPLPRSEVDSD